MNDYFALFEDIDQALGKRFGDILLHFHLIGFAALALAGLPDRGTKDVDALEETLRTTAIPDELFSNIEGFLKAEFGKGSPGGRRHGLYLDLVPKNIPWLPRRPRFIGERCYRHIIVSRLHPVDTCVSKTFSNFKRARDRAADRRDILDALVANIIRVEDYLRRLDETFPVYETHAEAPEVFPRVIRFVEEELLPQWAESELRLTYAIPSWMENM